MGPLSATASCLIADCTFPWLSMGYNFGCVMATAWQTAQYLILGVGFRGQVIRWRHSRFRGSNWDVAMTTIFGFLYMKCTLIGATWGIRMIRPCTSAMRPYVKLLWPLVMAAHSNRQAIIFYHVILSFFFFPRLISAVADWMSIFPHMMWP